MVKGLLYLFVLLSITITSSYSQGVKTRRIKKLPLEQHAYFPSFGNNKNEILVTGEQFSGLSVYNTRSRVLTLISEEEGAGVEPAIDPEGNIIYRVSSYENGRRKTGYKMYNPANKKSAPVSIESPVKDLQVKVKGKTLDIINNGQTIRSISPAGDIYYVWASLSPDKRRILFTAVGDGTYVTDLEGNILGRMDDLNSPIWMNNEWILGMNDKDDGHSIISSDVIAVHIASERRFNLTENTGEIAIYPQASPESKKIVFHSPKGEIFTMKIKLRK